MFELNKHTEEEETAIEVIQSVGKRDQCFRWTASLKPLPDKPSASKVKEYSR